jgi:hypothetical protein
MLQQLGPIDLHDAFHFTGGARDESYLIPKLMNRKAPDALLAQRKTPKLR